MFEKGNVQVFAWDERLSNNCPDALVKSLEGKPITLTVAGVKMILGYVRKVRRGRDGIFADLIIYMEETVNYIMTDGKISEFTAVALKPETAEIKPLPKTEEEEEKERLTLEVLNQFAITGGKHYWVGDELETMKEEAEKYQKILDLVKTDYQDYPVEDLSGLILRIADGEDVTLKGDVDRCPTCGLPVDLCVCKEVASGVGAASAEAMEMQDSSREPEAEPEPEPEPEKKPRKRSRRKSKA